VWQIQSIEGQPRLENVEESFCNENEKFGRTAKQFEKQIAEPAGAEPWSRQAALYAARAHVQAAGPASLRM